MTSDVQRPEPGQLWRRTTGDDRDRDGGIWVVVEQGGFLFYTRPEAEQDLVPGRSFRLWDDGAVLIAVPIDVVGTDGWARW